MIISEGMGEDMEGMGTVRVENTKVVIMAHKDTRRRRAIPATKATRRVTKDTPTRTSTKVIMDQMLDNPREPR
jgi:hypothetical protein